ncbi:DUF6377 domain-containing protein [Parabacteroides sp. OttesenSCG-928-G07]|nr:DUF6377 domain-containing protein [Parabacteroides sp. OttesenSCG-928-G21]MDL2277643.1 DUF6377 domain-containing protein [Parabacteroides sp. OttesenSCG-928-G07]
MKTVSRLVLFLFLLLITFSGGASEKQLDSLLLVLDKTIAEKHTFSERKNKNITELIIQIEHNTDKESIYHLYGQLFEEFKKYQLDSALAIVGKRIQLANDLNSPKHVSIAEMNEAEILMGHGMYRDALDILEKQSRVIIDYELKNYYYHLYHSLYILMADNALTEKDKTYYKSLECHYKDSILSVLSPEEIGYGLVYSSQLIEKGEYKKALDTASVIFQNYQENEYHIALSSYRLSEIYEHMGNKTEEKKYLAISAISDIRSGNREYLSLQSLANILYEEGDINRAYQYIKCSMEDALLCNARIRTLEISKIIPIINSAYDQKTTQEKDQLLWFSIIISVLSIVLVIALLYIYEQLKALAKARESLKQINNELKKVNDDLNSLNEELSESNLVKEEYIGYVFNICSLYITKLDDFRKKVNLKLQVGQTKELFNLTNSSSFVSDELKEFYRNFDTIFLHLYPDFVSEFNSLLVDGEKVLPREGELLSPELRIYALVKLGISDSVKIASFLHYSPQTVYNYRLKIRNKAKGLREDFPKAVKEIGRLRDSFL